MMPWLSSFRFRWAARLITLSVIIGVILTGLTVQFSAASQPVKASPMLPPVLVDISSIPPRPLATPFKTLPTAAPREKQEPLEPRHPVRTTPTPAAIVFPAPILPPAPDRITRTATVPILMYHYISTPPTTTDKIRVGLSVSPEIFESQLKLLADHGYSTISLFDLYQYLATGRALPDKPIVLTFDDGYVDNYTNAWPLLKKYGFKGTFFVLTAPADAKQPAYLSWAQIKEMSDSGMDMQLHAKDHVDLRHRDYDYLVWEIIGGRQSIEAYTGKPVIFMAYPSGKYDSAVLKFLASNNFWAAVTTESGKIHTLTDSLTWTRLRIAGQLTLTGFAKLLGIQ